MLSILSYTEVTTIIHVFTIASERRHELTHALAFRSSNCCVLCIKNRRKNRCQADWSAMRKFLAQEEVAMELGMQSHHFVARRPDWIAAATAGFVAGAAVMVMELFWSTAIIDVSPWAAAHMVAAIALGPGVLDSTAFSVGIVTVALLIHYVLGAMFGVILAAIIASFHLDDTVTMVLLAGSLFGGFLYLFNLHGMVYYFPWFAQMQNVVVVISNMLFGMTASFMYRQLKRDKKEK